MGWDRFKSSDYDTFTATQTKDASGRTKSAGEIFTSSEMKSEFDPRNIKVRESCDSPNNPEATPIIVALDVTGSMGFIPHHLVAGGLGTLMNDILDKKPVSDPHLMFMGIGDVEWDSAPLQVTQYEADVRIADQLKDIYIERGGGANDIESYTLPWYFAANKTKIDAYDKRGQKGILFTVGDEGVPPILTQEQIAQVFGDQVPKDLTAKELFDAVSEKYEVFHLIVQEGANYRKNPKFVENSWRDVLGERAILVKDYTKIPEIIVSTLGKLNQAASPTATAKANAVSDAIAGLKGKKSSSKKAATPTFTLTAA
ncbi:MAG TPA: hypothetical protein VIN59_01870 [Alphaproteobacteria bacterium]